MEKLTSKPRTLKELAIAYSVSKQTFKGWLSIEELKEVKPETGYYYSIKQVKIIIEHLGEPF
jgi:hypothetical protein